MTIEAEIQKLNPSALIDLFELDLNPIGVAETYFFSNDVNELGEDITWQGQVYTRFPIDAQGFERTGSGSQPRPTIMVGNATGIIGALANANKDLVDAKLTRRRTFVKYLDAVNFTGGVNATADPAVHLPDEIWLVDRKASENRILVQWELCTAADLNGKLLPGRQCIQNVCTWRYRSAECSYTGGAVADINDVLTTDTAQDACGKRLSSCQLRFPSPTALPFGGFPAVGLIR